MRRTRIAKTTLVVITMAQVLQMVGAVLILAAYVASQSGRLRPETVLYLALNFAGSGILAVLAAMEEQWGFLLLEGVWAVVSLLGLVRRVRMSSGG